MVVSVVDSLAFVVVLLLFAEQPNKVSAITAAKTTAKILFAFILKFPLLEYIIFS